MYNLLTQKRMMPYYNIRLFLIMKLRFFLLYYNILLILLYVLTVFMYIQMLIIKVNNCFFFNYTKNIYMRM